MNFDWKVEYNDLEMAMGNQESIKTLPNPCVFDKK